MKTMLFVTLSILFLVEAVYSQSGVTLKSLSIDPTRPYVDIAYVRLGHREPVFRGESTLGIWLKLRNNCVFPLKVYVLLRENSNEGALLVHDIVGGGNDGLDPLPSAPTAVIGKPLGYERPDVANSNEVQPGTDLLFSVPLDHVTREWGITVDVILVEPHSSAQKQPRILVRFDWLDLPKDAQRASDLRLFGESPAETREDHR